MKNFVAAMLTVTAASAFLPAGMALAQKTKQDAFKAIDSKADQYSDVAHRIWEFAEIGYQEVKSSELLQQTLTQAGFKVEKGVAGIPTAFVATYGSGKPVIAILGEFDALPGVSQDAVPELKSVPGRTAGHACGHHLFGTASSAAAIAVKDWLIANKKQGTIRVYGTPAEEGGSGKVYMVRDGLFSDVDVVLHWHPGSMNSASFGSSLANKSGKFRFRGIASHAAASPERGRSALDAVEAMDNMVNMMREHVPEDTRIHYVITRGGDAPNVVPAYSEVYYYVRHPDRDQVVSIWDRVIKAAEGAALGTETKMEFEVTGGVYNLLANEALSKALDANMHLVGGYKLTDEEKDFAEKIQKTFTTTPPKLETTSTIVDVGANGDKGGSTDVGDVSWVVPTAGLTTATWVPGTTAHSWQAVAAGGMTIGAKGMMMAAKTLAGTAIDLFEQPALIEQAKKEFNTRRPAGFKYDALVGNRKPALDYRK
jgi:aminobenzoyl-glutamate utilization protein B